MAQVTGVVFITVNEKQLQSKEGARLAYGGFERTAVMANDRVAGFAQKPVPAEVECTIPHRADTDLQDLHDTTDATILFRTDTGKIYLISQAFLTVPPELTGGEGDTTLTFQGQAAETIA